MLYEITTLDCREGRRDEYGNVVITTRGEGSFIGLKNDLEKRQPGVKKR